MDRLAVDENKTFHPEVLFVGGDGQAELAPKGVQVTAKVLGHELGKKIRIGKYKKRTGYKRHNGFRARSRRSRSSRSARRRPARRRPEGEAAAEEKPKAAPKPKAEAAARSRPAKKTRPRRRRRSNGAQEGPWLLAQRARLESEDARREDLRRPGSQGRDDHRPPARHALPARARARASAATTRSSPRRTARSSSGRAASAAPSRSSRPARPGGGRMSAPLIAYRLQQDRRGRRLRACPARRGVRRRLASRPARFARGLATWVDVRT